jgi:hypothetical protein
VSVSTSARNEPGSENQIAKSSPPLIERSLP